MAAITAIDATQKGSFTSAQSTLSADDTITIDAGKKQLLVLVNTTGGSLTCTVDGADGAVVAADGFGAGIDVSAGYDIVVAAGASKSVVLSTIRSYCQGVVHLKGAATLKATLFNL
jgi:hypothetical protein